MVTRRVDDAYIKFGVVAVLVHIVVVICTVVIHVSVQVVVVILTVFSIASVLVTVSFVGQWIVITSGIFDGVRSRFNSRVRGGQHCRLGCLLFFIVGAVVICDMLGLDGEIGGCLVLLIQ